MMAHKCVEGKIRSRSCDLDCLLYGVEGIFEITLTFITLITFFTLTFITLTSF